MTIAFVLTTCARDAPLAKCLLEQIRTHYPVTEIILIGDGCVFNDDLADLATICTSGKSLNDRSQPTKWLERMLHIALESSRTDYFIKFDPDCFMTRAFINMPNADLFGNLDRQNVRGGCYGFSRAIAFDILRFGVLRNLEIQKMVHPDRPNMSPLVVHEELQMTRAVQLLEGVITHWDDINVRWRPHFKESEINSSYSVWHPVQQSTLEGGGDQTENSIQRYLAI